MKAAIICLANSSIVNILHETNGDTGDKDERHIGDRDTCIAGDVGGHI